MFKIINAKKYNEMQLKIEAQAALLSNQRCVMDEQNAELDKSEKEKHNIVNAMRYSLQTASFLMNESPASLEVDSISNRLPYLLNGFQIWEPYGFGQHKDESARDSMILLAKKYKFKLPESGADSVLAMLDLSMALMNPINNHLLESLQKTYPLD